MQYNWDWSILAQEPYRDWLVSGFAWTLAVSGASWLLALVLGLPIGIARTAERRWLRSLAAIYVELFRNIPALAQLFLWFYVIPELLPDALGLWVKRDMPLPEFTTAVVAIGCFSGARVAEQVRAGIESTGQGPLRAALSTGLRRVQAYRLVVLPLALRAVVLPLTSEFLIAFKMSSISLTVGILELTAQSRHIENYTFHGFEAFAAATVLYSATGLLIIAGMRRLHRHIRLDRGLPA